MNCSICGKTDDLECPACDKRFCISCFVDHGKACYEQGRKKTEQGEKKTHEAGEKQQIFKNCVQCGNGINTGNYYDSCSQCGAPVCCMACQMVHQSSHRKAKHQCCMCHAPVNTECDECHKPYCLPCFAKHRAVHEQQRYTRPTYSRINFDDFKINLDPSWMEDVIKQGKEAAERVRQEQEAKQKKQEEEYQREKARLNEEFFRRFFGGSYASFSSSSTELEMAFSLLQLSTRATVQEVTRAFRQKAKQGEYKHPDVGGSHEQFTKLNNAYELALAHAKRNER